MRYSGTVHVNAELMDQRIAKDLGYEVGDIENNIPVDGYEVIHGDGRKEWVLKDEFDDLYKVSESELDRMMLELETLNISYTELDDKIKFSDFALGSLIEEDQLPLARLQRNLLESHIRILNIRKDMMLASTSHIGKE